MHLTWPDTTYDCTLGRVFNPNSAYEFLGILYQLQARDLRMYIRGVMDV